MKKLLLTATEVAQLVGLSDKQIHRLNDRGDIPRPVRVGGSVRWRTSELEDWVDSGCPHRQQTERNTQT